MITRVLLAFTVCCLAGELALANNALTGNTGNNSSGKKEVTAAANEGANGSSATSQSNKQRDAKKAGAENSSGKPALDELAVEDGDSKEAENAVIQTLQIMKAKKQSKGPRKVTGEKPSDAYSVATVGNDTITNIDIMNAIRFILFSSGKEFDKNSAKLIVKSILKKLIAENIQKQVAGRNGITVSSIEISKRIQDIAERNGLTVQELADEFRNRGINIEIFKQGLFSRLLSSSITQALRRDVTVTNKEVADRKKQYSEEIKQKRYHVYEIYFRIDDKKVEKEILQNANEVHKLLQNGFDFVSLAENVSQGNYRENVGDLGWISLNSLDKQIASAVSSLKPKEFSSIIRTSTGIRILFVDDIAEPGRLGSDEAIYKYFKVRVKYRGKLFTSKDSKQAAEMVGKMQEAKSVDELKKICTDNKIEFEEKEEQIKNPLMLNILGAANGKTVTIEAPDDQDCVELYRTVRKESPPIPEIKEEEIKNELVDKKVGDVFSKTFKRVETTTYVNINQKNVERLMKELK